MAKSKNEKSKIKVEQVGSPSKSETPITPPVDQAPPDTDVELFDLQKEAIKLGMPEETAGKFKDVALLQDTVNTLKAVGASQVAPVQTEPVNPREDARIEKVWKSKAERMKAYLDGRPKVRIIIPCDAKEKAGTVVERSDGKKVYAGAWWSKTFNGYRVDVPKGVYTEVPIDIADNISAEFNQVQADLARFGIDRIDEKTGKPVADRLT